MLGAHEGLSGEMEHLGVSGHGDERRGSATMC
jgi:hypothetical protein